MLANVVFPLCEAAAYSVTGQTPLPNSLMLGMLAHYPLASIPGAEIELRLSVRGGRLSGWEGELESSVVPPWDWCFEVGVAGVDELGVVAA